MLNIRISYAIENIFSRQLSYCPFDLQAVLAISAFSSTQCQKPNETCNGSTGAGGD